MDAALLRQLGGVKVRLLWFGEEELGMRLGKLVNREQRHTLWQAQDPPSMIPFDRAESLSCATVL